MPSDETRVNEQIRADRVRLIGPDGTQHGLKTVPEALQIAQEEGLDLVEVAGPPAADPPVCKIMEYAKYKADQEQRQRGSGSS
ncbi:MAG: translation initiation factor IF-3 [Acidimicrobiia bacterium]